MKSGIYRIVNTLNEKCYVGQTVDLKRRFSNHKSSYKNSRGNHPVLHHAINKYGWSAFKYEVICRCPIEYLNKMEIHFISHFNSYSAGYNANKGGHESVVPKPIYQYDNKGFYINKWESVKDAAKYYNCSESLISGTLNNSKRITAFGFLWSRQKVVKLKNTRIPISNPIPVDKYNVKGELIMRFDSISDAVKHEKGSINIERALKEGGLAGGYAWVFKGAEFKEISRKKMLLNGLIKVNQYTLEGVLVNTFNNPKEASEHIGSKSIYHCLNNITKSSNGFVWRYEDQVFGAVVKTKRTKEQAIKDKKNKEEEKKDKLFLSKYNKFVKEFKKKAIKRPVIQLTLEGKYLNVFNSAAEAEKETGVSCRKIPLVCNGKRNQTGGYKWIYK